MIRAVLFALLAFAAPALAQDGNDVFRLGDDIYVAGGTLSLDTEGTDDVFAAGENIDLRAPITGSAYLAGRRVATHAEVAGMLFASGADVAASAPVGGDAMLMGYDVSVAAAVGGDLRAAARHLKLDAPVGGTALLAADTVEIDAAIAGDVAITANVVEFGPGASIGGRLKLSTGEDEPVVPESVIPPDRIERHALTEDLQILPEHGPRDWMAIATGAAIGALILTILVTLLSLIAPAGVERLSRIAADRPWRTFGMGFLALAVLVGSAILLALTILGLLAAPVVLLAAFGFAFLGYLIGVWMVGRGIWGWIGLLEPDTLGERFLTALIGAVIVGLAALVPFLAWFAVPVLTLLGLGALIVAWLHPGFGHPE